MNTLWLTKAGLSEVWRQLSTIYKKKNGEFIIKGLVPGNWKIRYIMFYSKKGLFALITKKGCAKCDRPLQRFLALSLDKPFFWPEKGNNWLCCTCVNGKQCWQHWQSLKWIIQTSIRAWKRNFPPFKEFITDRPSDLPTNRQTDRMGHREISLPIRGWWERKKPKKQQGRKLRTSTFL